MIMREENLNQKELIRFQNIQNLENLLNKIKIFKREFEKDMISYGMTSQTIKKVFEGKEIYNCQNCNTPNVYESVHDKTHNVHIYKCDNCGESF